METILFVTLDNILITDLIGEMLKKSNPSGNTINAPTTSGKRIFFHAHT